MFLCRSIVVWPVKIGSWSLAWELGTHLFSRPVPSPTSAFELGGSASAQINSQPVNFLAFVLYRTTQPHLEALEAFWICSSQASASDLLRWSQLPAEIQSQQDLQTSPQAWGEGILQTIYCLIFIKASVLKGNVFLTQFFSCHFPIHPISLSCKNQSTVAAGSYWIQHILYVTIN